MAADALPDRLIAVGMMGTLSQSGPEGVVWTSTDGQRWTRSDSAAFQGCTLVALASANGTSWIGGDRDSRASIWRSTDGVTWQLVDLPTSGFGRVARIVADGVSLVAFGTESDTTAAWHSADGSTWEKATLPVETSRSFVTAVTRFGNHWVALMTVDRKAVWPLVSTDGLTWSRGKTALPLVAPTSSSTPYINDLVVYRGSLIAVGQAGTGANTGAVAWASGDGSTWTPVVIPTIAREKGDMTGIQAAFVTSNGIIAVGEGGTWTTTDGKTWKPAPATAGGYRGGPTYAEPYFVDVTAFRGRLYAVALAAQTSMGDIGVSAFPSAWSVLSPVG
ncbi:MAG: hypothetical protein ACXWNR_01785 [Candidatus Limnocylindrales bacterium]